MSIANRSAGWKAGLAGRGICLGLVESILLAVVFVLALGPATGHAQQDQPRVTQAFVDVPKAGRIQIIGGGFGVSPRVTLGSSPLNIVTASDEAIVADLPMSLPPGSYALVVASGNGASQRAFFELTIGAVGRTGATGPSGPQGPPGLTGLPGIVGPTGPAGTTGSAGTAGDTGVGGPTGATGPSGPMGPTGAVAGVNERCPRGEALVGFSSNSAILCARLCDTDDECPEESEYCDRGECSEPCQTNEQCGEGFGCNATSGRCVCSGGDCGGSGEPPSPIDCCFLRMDVGSCAYQAFDDSCSCEGDPSPFACNRPVVPPTPAGFPPPTIPVGGSAEPPSQPQSANHCDYSYCYSYENGSWTSQPRGTETPTQPPDPPPPGFLPQDPPSPFSAYNYCDRFYCYSKTPEGYWVARYRYGSELIDPRGFTSTSFCSLHYCYSLGADGQWEQSAIDPAAAGTLPSEIPPPADTPAPIGVSQDVPLPSGGSCCEGAYCYTRNHYGVLGATWTNGVHGGAPSCSSLSSECGECAQGFGCNTSSDQCIPLPSNDDEIVACCTTGADTERCVYEGASCQCTFSAEDISCALEPSDPVPPGYPLPILPASSRVPPPQPEHASHCDYDYCYVHDSTTATWTHELRDSNTSPPPPLNVPVPGFSPPDPPVPFAPYNYCDLYYCYSRTPGGQWYSNLRYGSELIEALAPTENSYYGMHHSYVRATGAWNASLIDPAADPALGPPPKLPPDFHASPSTPPPGSAAIPGDEWCCDDDYAFCHRRNHYGVWVSEYAGGLATAPQGSLLCSTIQGCDPCGFGCNASKPCDPPPPEPECTSDGQCSAGEYCSGGTCEPGCRSQEPDGCGAGFGCNTSSRVCFTSCGSDAECDEGFGCNVSSMGCFPTP